MGLLQEKGLKWFCEEEEECFVPKKELWEMIMQDTQNSELLFLFYLKLSM